MANPEHLEILENGVDVWNEWRDKNPRLTPDLSGANLNSAKLNNARLHDTNLSDADLRGAILSRANLIDADLSRADLSGAELNFAYLRDARLSDAKLVGAELSGADLTRAFLSRADLSRADLGDADLSLAHLNGANLRGADLKYANLIGADLKGADLSKTTFLSTVIDETDLSEVKGLDTIKHAGPSTIGVATLYRSKGNLPEVFLRGVGFPENFIEYLGSLVGKAFEFYSCFISYSSKNEDFAKRLHADLQEQGVRCWFAPEDIKGGRKLHEQIPEAIRLYDKLLLVLSEHSMNSEWVKTEIYHARQDEIRNEKRKLFPLGLVDFETIRKWEAFDADAGKDMAREVREYFIPDFSNWKDHDAYQKAFDRLLRDLRAEE